MTIHNQPYSVKKAAEHIMDRSILTKDDQASPLEAISRKFGDHVAATLEKLGATNTEIAGIKEQLAELDQKMARGGGGGGDYQAKSIGSTITDSPELHDFQQKAASGKGGVSINVKASITSSTSNAAGSAGAGIVANRDALVPMTQQRLTVRDLLPVIRVTGNSVEYPRQNGRTNNAAPVAEAAAKPSSDLQLELKTTPIRTIAHWMKASKQVVDDMPQLRGLIDGELMYGLKLKEEAQLLLGDNTGQNLHGLVPQATAFSAAFDPAGTETNIDTIGLAILQNALADLPADGIIVHPSDWVRMCLLKDAGGNYIFGDPTKVARKVLWGVPLVDTPSMTIDKFLVGNFQMAATLYDRWEARIEVGYENDDFTKNMITILCEERIGLAVKRPAALTYGDFGNV